MRRIRFEWLPCVLLACGLCELSAEAWGQEAGATWRSTDPAYSPAGDPIGAAPMMPPQGYVVSYADQSELSARVADLAAEVQGLKEAGAKAKATAAGKPSVVAGGRIMTDWANFTQNAASKAQAGDFQNGVEARRARVYLEGEAFEVVDYKLQFELASSTKVPDFPSSGDIGIGQVSFKDVYVTVKELPLLGNVRIGHFKTPFGLENLTSHRYSTFMERAMVSEGEIEGRRLGAVAFDHSESEMSTWALGIFTSQIPENPPRFQDDGGGAAAMMRRTFLPWYDEATEGRGLLHTGVSYSYADIGESSTVRFSEDPEAHLASQVIDTGTMADVSHINAVGAEAALVYGPLSLQSEFVSFWLDRTANPNPTFHGAYAYVSYFLTGEHRQYDRSVGEFDRVEPFENFFRVRDVDGCVQTGKGAWEIAYRYSYMDLNSSGVNGGLASNHTFGLNWYLNPYTRMMFNYIVSDTTNHPDAGGVGHVDIFQMRCQIDF